MAQSIFGKINSNLLNEISSRKIETLSAGELKTVYIEINFSKSTLMIIDEPFSNSDEKLWIKIYAAINLKESSIILSHFSLKNFLILR